MTVDCFICDEGYNGPIPCPQCNTRAWNEYHERHKQVITVVERGSCSHERHPVVVEGEGRVYDGALCPLCRDVVDVRPVPHATAETVQ